MGKDSILISRRAALQSGIGLAVLAGSEWSCGQEQVLTALLPPRGETDEPRELRPFTWTDYQRLAKLVPQKTPTVSTTVRLRLIRPEDGIDLSFRLARIPKGVINKHGKFALLIAEMPAQAFIQPPIKVSSPIESDDCSQNATYPQQRFTRLSAPSFVAMLVDLEAEEELDLETVLRWSKHPLYSDDTAPDLSSNFVAPAGLNLRPTPGEVFFAAVDPRRDGTIRQLWTARLVQPMQPTAADSSTFSATQNRRPTVQILSSRKLLDGDEMLVKPGELDGIVQGTNKGPVSAERLLLSSQGAWLDVGAAWPPTTGRCSNSSFYERIAHGMEQQAQTTYLARLCPTGHVVTVVKSGKLQWCRKDGQSPLVAEFIERIKITYNQTLKSYDSRYDGERRRSFYAPINSVRLIGKETPYLDVTPAEDFITSCQNGKVVLYKANYINAAGQSVPYDFPVEITDRAGQTHRTTMRMLVALYERERDDAYRQAFVTGYNDIVDLQRERVAYAVPTSAGNTSYPTQNISLVAHEFASGAGNFDGAPWYPVMNSATLLLEQVSAFHPAAQPTPAICHYAQPYTDDPFDVPRNGTPIQNRAEVMLAVEQPLPFEFDGSRGGGLAKPASRVVGLARKAGTVFSYVGDAEQALKKISSDGMKVADIFGQAGAAASLLGAIQLSDILDEVSDGIAEISKLPQLAVQQIRDAEATVVNGVRTALANILALQNTPAFQSLLQAAQQVETTYKQIRSAIQLATSLLRVLATEQAPSDVDDLADQTLDPDPDVRTRAANLHTRLTLPILDRIPLATSFPGDVLPTLYVLRDYVVHLVIASPRASDLIASLDLALATGADDFQRLADSIYFEAGNAIEQLAETPAIRLCLAVAQLNKDLNANPPDPAALVLDVQNVFDAATALSPELQTTVGQFQDFAKQVSDNVTLQTQLLTQALQDRIDRFNTALQNSAAIVGDTIYQQAVQALAANGPVQQALKIPSLSQVNTLVQNITSAIQGLQDFLSALNTLADTVSQVMSILNAVKAVKVGYTYDTTLHNAGPFVASYDGDDRATFHLETSLQMDLTDPTPKFSVHAEVNNFQLNLVPGFEFVSIGFKQVTFDWHEAGSPSVNVHLDPKDIELLGPLDFVSSLSSVLHLPPGLNVQLTGAGVVVGYNTMLPPIAGGAFNIVNLSLYTAVKLNFNGSPMRVIFGFASPNRHFTVTYFFLGGGGFLNLEFTPTAVAAGMTVSGAIEVGAMAALDFGIADGDVYAFVGIYFSLSANDVTLSGYFRAGGEVEVLGIVSVSIELLMSLTYEDRNGQAWLSGDCEVEVDVSVLFFSESVTLHLHHDFSGSAMD